MDDSQDFSSQSTTNESQSHDRHSQFDLNEDEQPEQSESEDEEDVETSSDFVWELSFRDDADEFWPETHPENSATGFTAESSPLTILQHIITEEMLQKVCEESRKYAEQKGIANFRPFDVAELWRFFAVNLAMGINKLPSIKDYWKTKTLFNVPFFRNTMSRDRFMEILRCIHFTNNEEIPVTNTDRFIKLGTFMDDIVKNFKSLVHPGEYLCLDESMVPYKGRLSIKQYNPKKRTRFGVKLFILADCATKVILDIVPYQGKYTKMTFKNLVKDLGFGGATVVSMLESYFQKGHRVIVDNWFNSPKLARLLKSKKTYVLGTVQRKRKGMPRTRAMARKMKKGEVEIFSDGDILVERWCDRRDVLMLNSFLAHSMIEADSTNPRNVRLKPGSVLLYNSKMGAVDDADRIIKPYKSLRKTYKWYRKVAFHLVDLAVYNSFLVYSQLQNKKIPYQTYLDNLISEILAKHPKPATQRGRPVTIARDEDRMTGPHFSQKVLKDGKPSRGDCYYCRKVFKKRKLTPFRCIQCQKRLCIGADQSCFFLYHTQPKLKKVGPTPIAENPRGIPIASQSAPVEGTEESTQFSESLLNNNIYE